MDIDNLNKAKRLNLKIIETEQFLRVFKDEANVIRGSGSRDIKGIIKIDTKKSMSIFGSRWFGIGSHKIELDIPSEMVSELEYCFEQKLIKLKEELEQL